MQTFVDLSYILATDRLTGRRRKKRCFPRPATPGVCEECFARGAQCRNQEISLGTKRRPGDGKSNLQNRVAELETVRAFLSNFFLFGSKPRSHNHCLLTTWGFLPLFCIDPWAARQRTQANIYSYSQTCLTSSVFLPLIKQCSLRNLPRLYCRLPRSWRYPKQPSLMMLPTMRWSSCVRETCPLHP